MNGRFAHLNILKRTALECSLHGQRECFGAELSSCARIGCYTQSSILSARRNVWSLQKLNDAFKAYRIGVGKNNLNAFTNASWGAFPPSDGFG